MERQRPENEKEERVVVKSRKSVFESVFDASYVPFEDLFNEASLGARASRENATEKSHQYAEPEE